MGRQHQGMDRPGVRQVPEGGGEQGKMEKTGCKILCGAQKTLAVKILMMMMMTMMMKMMMMMVMMTMTIDTHLVSLTDMILQALLIFMRTPHSKIVR